MTTRVVTEDQIVSYMDKAYAEFIEKDSDKVKLGEAMVVVGL